MGYTEHWCRGCNGRHDAAFWFYQSAPAQGRFYLCGEQYNAMAERATWQALEPGDPYESQQIRYCYYCDGPISGAGSALREFEQGFHDRCAALKQPKPTTTRRPSGRRAVGRTTSRRSTPRGPRR